MSGGRRVEDASARSPAARAAGATHASTAPAVGDEARVRTFRGRLALLAGGAVLGTLSRLYGTFWIGIAAVLLVLSWQSAPERLIDAHRFASFTARADGRILESWLALEWDPSDMADHLRWHAYAKAAACAMWITLLRRKWTIASPSVCARGAWKTYTSSPFR